VDYAACRINSPIYPLAAYWRAVRQGVIALP
jgi:hypothetical protein